MKTMAFFNYMETIGRILLQSPPVTKSTATHMLILSGQVLTEDRLFLLRKSERSFTALGQQGKLLYRRLVPRFRIHSKRSVNVPDIRHAGTGLYRQRNEHAQYVDQRIRDRNPNVHRHQQTVIEINKEIV